MPTSPRARLLVTLAGQGLLLLPVLLLPSSGARTLATVAFLVGAPALPVLLSFRRLDLLLRVVLGGSVAVVVNSVVAEFMVVTTHWSVDGGIVAVGLTGLAIALVGFWMAQDARRRHATEVR